MIGVDVSDRDALRFLWWSNEAGGEMKEYRHKRVPFGANCSPFILGAILEKHLTSVEGSKQEVAIRLWESLYVDNCCSSESTVTDYKYFQKEAIGILSDAKMDLRMWMSSVEDLTNTETKIVSVLGMLWDRQHDCLYVDVKGINIPMKATKRTVLATVSKVYDPVGITAPATLTVKLLLQRFWTMKLSWDEELPLEQQEQFLNWIKEIQDLGEIKIPRNLDGGVADRSQWELHFFSDGSKVAYAAVGYLRIRTGNTFRVSLLMAKSKVAPLKNMTIPRLELLGCLIAARLYHSVTTALKLDNVKVTFWSDSTTALAWIKRIREWDTFVGRRVTEVTSLTDRSTWRHVPGEYNPADLPSRGCKPKFLLDCKWTEGPTWLKFPERQWPTKKYEENEDDIKSEERKTPLPKQTSSFVTLDVGKEVPFVTIVRIQAWVRRFIRNCREPKVKSTGLLKAAEIERAELDVLRQVQSEAFNGDDKPLKGLEYFVDEVGLWRLTTKLTFRKDDSNFKNPVILPRRHFLVRQLIRDTHRQYCHAGVGFLLVKLRRKYWLLKGRQTIRGVISKCHRCRMYAARATVTPTAPLPEDRVKDADVFETTGVDLAGPFFTKNGKKVWLVIYTCAVYRAVVLRMLSSLSTKAFIKSLGDFTKEFRRPVTIYSDNGTNFRGSDNLFKALDWKSIQEAEGVSQIIWNFNPASAPWWGGWWERLIKTMKDLLRKTIGKALLSAAELYKVVEKVEEVMNDRPLTYVNEDPDGLEPLTPSMFLKPLGNTRFPEKDLVDGEELRYRYKYLQSLMKDLKTRFRNEYLGMLVSRNPKKASRPLKVGELVVVGCDNKKRSLWPLGRILELRPGKDGISRVAKVKTADGDLVRAVQRLYALEADCSDPVAEAGEMMTRSGRRLKRPET